MTMCTPQKNQFVDALAILVDIVGRGCRCQKVVQPRGKPCSHVAEATVLLSATITKAVHRVAPRRGRFHAAQIPNGL